MTCVFKFEGDHDLWFLHLRLEFVLHLWFKKFLQLRVGFTNEVDSYFRSKEVISHGTVDAVSNYQLIGPHHHFTYKVSEAILTCLCDSPIDRISMYLRPLYSYLPVDYT